MLGMINYFIDFYLWHVVNVGKKVVCLQCRFKSWGRIERYWLLLCRLLWKCLLVKRHTVLCCTFCFWQFALFFLGLGTHYRQSWSTKSVSSHGAKHRYRFSYIATFRLFKCDQACCLWVNRINHHIFHSCSLPVMKTLQHFDSPMQSTTHNCIINSCNVSLKF